MQGEYLCTRPFLDEAVSSTMRGEGGSITQRQGNPDTQEIYDDSAEKQTTLPNVKLIS